MLGGRVGGGRVPRTKIFWRGREKFLGVAWGWGLLVGGCRSWRRWLSGGVCVLGMVVRVCVGLPVFVGRCLMLGWLGGGGSLICWVGGCLGLAAPAKASGAFHSWPGSDPRPSRACNDPLVFRSKMRYVGRAGGGRAGPPDEKFFGEGAKSFFSVLGRGSFGGSGVLGIGVGRGGCLRRRLPGVGGAGRVGRLHSQPGPNPRPSRACDDPLVFRLEMRYVGWAGGGRAGPPVCENFFREREKRGSAPCGFSCLGR